MSKEVAEAGALERPVRGDIERVRLGIEAPQVELVEVVPDRSLDELHTESAVATRGFEDMKVHEGVVAELDAILDYLGSPGKNSL